MTSFDFSKAIKTLELMLKMKKRMNEKGLRAAKAKCPECDGHLYMSISKYNGHAVMSCDGTCGTAIRE